MPPFTGSPAFADDDKRDGDDKWSETHLRCHSLALAFVATPPHEAASIIVPGDVPMKSPICDMLGIEFPLLAFSHCRDVVAAVSRAGGFGVLGATAHSPETLEQELKWIDEHVDGK